MKNRGYVHQTKGNTYRQPCYCCGDNKAQSCKHVRVAAGHLAYVCLTHCKLPVSKRLNGEIEKRFAPVYQLLGL